MLITLVLVNDRLPLSVLKTVTIIPQCWDRNLPNALTSDALQTPYLYDAAACPPPFIFSISPRQKNISWTRAPAEGFEMAHSSRTSSTFYSLRKTLGIHSVMAESKMMTLQMFYNKNR